MTNYSEAGKGDDQRPTDNKKFSDGYDLIWGKKVSKEVAQDINQQLQDAFAEDQEFERIERELRERPCQKENP